MRAIVEPTHEEEFNRWYNQDIPDVLKLIPGCLGAARNRVLDGDGSHQYMALYRFANEAALRSVLQGSEINLFRQIPANIRERPVNTEANTDGLNRRRARIYVAGCHEISAAKRNFVASPLNSGARGSVH